MPFTRALLPSRRWIALLVLIVASPALLLLTLFTDRARSAPVPEQDVPLAGQDTLIGSSSASGGSWFTRKEKCFMSKINKKRARNGKRKLNRDPQLGYVARRHARTIASAGSVYHDDIGSKVTRWRSLGQNTGAGNGCRVLMRAFWNSSSHRANILGRWRHMGVGVEKRNGTVYVQQVFESRRDPGNIWHRP
ncbi:MAG TPA: CAP domain-containing protein [Actinomycetota bacterium]|nr:CAP domain-containing protein [Actinomycetota bacterium]